MDAQQVTDKILADSQSEAQEINRQARQRQTDQKAQLDRQLEEFNRQTEKLAQKAADDRKLQLLTAERMDLAKQSLAEKRKILDEVFARAKETLEKLPDQKYRDFVTRLMLQAVETGDEEVIVDKNEKRIDHEFIKLINRKLGPGYKGNLRLSEKTQELGGGFILQRGKIKNNVSFGVLLVQTRQSLEIQLAKELFKD